MEALGLATSVQRLPYITKIVEPRRRSDAIVRARLTDALRAGLGKRAQIVWAPAGYGKTTLLSELTSRTEWPVCWYTFTAEDREPAEFVRYCAKAVELRLGPLSAGDLTRTGEPARREWHSLLGHLVTALQMQLQGELIFVFDDLHQADECQEIKQALALFMERAPQSVHFLLASRTRPTLACLPKLTVQGEVATFDLRDLGFRNEEAVALLAAIWRRPVSAEEAQAVVDSTSGWPAGIALLARTGKAGAALPADGNAGRQVLFDYLAEEVLLKLRERHRAFLLQSSTLREFTAQLCDGLLGRADSQQELQELIAQGCFLEERLAQERSYRYHDLFRDFLQHRLRSEQPELFVALHRKAVALAERLGDDESALFHLLKAGDVAAAALYIRRVGEGYFERGKWQTLQGWLARLPAGVVEADPQLLLLQAKLHLRLGQPDLAVKCLDNIIEGGLKPAEATVGKALVARSAATRLLGNLKAARESAERGLETLGKAGGLGDDLAEAHRQLASVLATQGEFVGARQQFEQALAQTTEGDLQLRSAIHDGLAGVYILLGALDTAALHLEKARQGWLKLENQGALAECLSNLSLLYYYRGDFDIALDELAEAQKHAAAAGYQRLMATIRISQGLVRAAMGELKPALDDVMAGLQGARAVLDLRLVARATNALGNIYRRLGELGKAETLLRQAIAEAEESGQAHTAAWYQLSVGKVHLRAGALKDGMEAIERAEGLFGQQGSLRGLAEAKLQRGLAMNRLGQVQDALRCIGELGQMLEKLGYEGFLAADAEEAKELLRLGVAKGVGGPRVAGLLHRLEGSAEREAATPSGKRGREFPVLSVRGLGEAQVVLDNHSISEHEWRSRRAKELLFFLLCRDRPASRDELIAALWPEAAPGQYEDALRMNVHRLRRAVYPDLVLSHGDGYRINPDVPVRFDVREFERALHEAERCASGSEARIARLTEATALYGGPLLDEVYSEWCEPLRRSLEQKYQQALLEMARHALAAGKHSRASELLEMVLTSDPYDEAAVLMLAQAHLSRGDAPAALRRLRDYIKVASEELELEPSQELLGLYKDILSRGPKLALASS